MLSKKMAVFGDAITMAYIKMCTKAGAAARELKDDVSGMEIIQVVMIIAIGVVSVAAVWAVLGPFIQKLWTQISGKGEISPLTLHD